MCSAIKLCLPFKDEGDDDWMSRHFFTGGQMPSYDLFNNLTSTLTLSKAGRSTGATRHHCAWLERIDAVADLSEIFPGLSREEAKLMYRRWRIFFLSCEELFAFHGGDEWLVGHYLLRPVQSDAKRGAQAA